jgi:hypothetical protein
LDRINKIHMIDAGKAGNQRAAPSLTVGFLPLGYFL